MKRELIDEDMIISRTNKILGSINCHKSITLIKVNVRRYFMLKTRF